MTPNKAVKNDTSEIFTLLGLGLTLLHEIEDNFAKSLLFGLNERDRQAGRTFAELQKSREEMTFGRMAAILKEEWRLHPLFEWFLDFFVNERNLFVHKLTRLHGYGLLRRRERQRLKKRLIAFVQIAMGARELFESAMFASAHLAMNILRNKSEEAKDLELPEEVMARVIDILELCQYKGPAKPGLDVAVSMVEKPVLVRDDLTANINRIIRIPGQRKEGKVCIYLCRWPNGDLSLVFGQTRRDTLDALDEIDDPSNCSLIPIRSGALHLKLTDEGRLEYEGVSEEVGEAVAKAHPIIENARGEVCDRQIDEGSPEGKQALLTAVVRERKRKVKSHGIDVFQLLYGHSIRRARKEALADPKTPDEVKTAIRKAIKQEAQARKRVQAD